MSKLKCSNCGREKGIFSSITEPWYRCPNCGIICNNCDTGSTIGAAIGLTKKRCPSCGNKLEPLK